MEKTSFDEQPRPVFIWRKLDATKVEKELAFGIGARSMV